MIDVHAHITSTNFDPEKLDRLLISAKQDGVEHIISVSETINDCHDVLTLAAQSNGMIWPSLGLHPVQYVSDTNQERSVTMDDWFAFRPTLEKAIADQSIVGVGEIGLDFSRHIVQQNSNNGALNGDEKALRQVQCDVFRAQVEMAVKAGLPVNVHSRSAGHYALSILYECGASLVNMHAFDGKSSYTRKAVEEHGYYFSIPPSIIRSPQKEALAKALPMNALLLESDSPALGPEKGIDNEPRNIKIAAQAISQSKSIPIDTVNSMTTSKYEESVKELTCSDDSRRLKALRFIKNSVIGNKTKKELYIQLGVVDRLVDYITLPDTDSTYNLKIQAVTILGSIAYGKDENVASVVASGAIGPLLDSLALPPGVPEMQAIQTKRKLLEASTRALKAIFSSSSSTFKDDIFTEAHLRSIVALLKITSTFLIREQQPNATSDGLSFGMIAEFIATIIAKCCDTHEQQLQLASAGVVQALTNLLHCGYIKAQEAALDALSTLGRENAHLAEIIIHAKSFDSNQLTTATMIEFVKNKCPRMRLIAATCLTNLYRSDVFTDPFDEIILVVLPALVRLMNEETSDVQEQAPLVLADLIKDSEDMQKAAFESDTIPKLAELLASVSGKDSDQNEEIGVAGVGSVEKRKEKTKENSLIALAAATLLKEECRAQAIEHKILPHVVSALQSNYPNVRLAACQCAKSLSRSVSNLRTSLVDAGIAPPLIKLLYDDSLIVQAAACGALCNMALDFSPMKKTVIDAGATSKFVEFSRSSDPELQLNGIWAIKSLLYKADLPAKKAIMDALTYDSLIELLHEPKPGVQEQAMDAVRNLICGQVEDVEYVIEGIGQDDLLDVLESKLQVTSTMGKESDDDDEPSQATLEAALYIVVNMCSSSEEPKAIVMSRENIVNSVIHYLGHESSSIRLGAVWCIINWTWAETGDSEDAVNERVERLRELGVGTILKQMQKDLHLDVRYRVGTALSQLGIPVDEDADDTEDQDI